MGIHLAELKEKLGILDKENGVLKMQLAELGSEKDLVTNQVIELTVQLRVNESQVREMLAKLDITAARETSLEARAVELEQAMNDVLDRLAMAQQESHRAAEEVARLRSELHEANDREGTLLDQADILSRDLKLDGIALQNPWHGARSPTVGDRQTTERACGEGRGGRSNARSYQEVHGKDGESREGQGG